VPAAERAGARHRGFAVLHLKGLRRTDADTLAAPDAALPVDDGGNGTLYHCKKIEARIPKPETSTTSECFNIMNLF
jgi:hypothetical protein